MEVGCCNPLWELLGSTVLPLGFSKDSRLFRFKRVSGNQRRALYEWSAAGGSLPEQLGKRSVGLLKGSPNCSDYVVHRSVVVETDAFLNGNRFVKTLGKKHLRLLWTKRSAGVFVVYLLRYFSTRKVKLNETGITRVNVFVMHLLFSSIRNCLRVDWAGCWSCWWFPELQGFRLLCNRTHRNPLRECSRVYHQTQGFRWTCIHNTYFPRNTASWEEDEHRCFRSVLLNGGLKLHVRLRFRSTSGSYSDSSRFGQWLQLVCWIYIQLMEMVGLNIRGQCRGAGKVCLACHEFI